MKYSVIKNDKETVAVLNGKLEAYNYQSKNTFSGESTWKDKIEWIAGFLWMTKEKDQFKIVNSKGEILRYDRNEYERMTNENRHT